MKKTLKIFVVVIAFLMVAGGSFYGGISYGTAKKAIRITDSQKLLNTDFSLFWEAVDTVKSRFVHIKDVSDQDLLYGAIQGVVGALKDPYSSFFNPSDAKKFEQDLRGSFGGIGAEIGIRNNQLVVIAPLKNNPAEKAGLKAGDKILKVDEIITNNLTVDEAVKLIRGEPGTKVTLLIFRDGWNEAKEFLITRATIVVPTLDWEMRENGIAYIHLYNFNANASFLFSQAMFSALTKGVKGIVVDLRDNPGGYLDVAVDLAGWFVKRGETVVWERFYDGTEEAFRASGNAALVNIPVVVLVNGGSASASEILAGALRDLRGAELIGEKTFGKGSVQEIETLRDGSTVKISIAEWLTPHKATIEKQGLTPDIEIKPAEDEKSENDPQLEKALEMLEQKIKTQQL